MASSQPTASTSKPQPNGIHSRNASLNGQDYLDPKSALKHLETYQKGDGLSLHELMDSSKHGGLTCTSSARFVAAR